MSKVIPVQLLFATVLAGSATLMGGLVPDLTREPSQWFNSVAHAQQNISDTEITRFARAILDMEPNRQNTYNQIKKLVGNNVPNILCHRQGTFSGLPAQARKMAQSYCNQSRAIVENNGLTIERFNQITSKIQQDQSLREKIQAELSRLQQ